MIRKTMHHGQTLGDAAEGEAAWPTAAILRVNISGGEAQVS